MKELSNHTKHPVGVLLILVGLRIIATPVLEPTVLAQSPVNFDGYTFWLTKFKSLTATF